MNECIDERIATTRGTATAVAMSGERKIRLLVFTSLYPNEVQPRHGVFVEERLRHLVDSGRIEATVVAPVPWFPFTHPRFGAYAAFAGVPASEQRYGITISHPRYLVIPKFGMDFAPSLMVRALRPCLRKLQSDGHDFDLIDAHYFYPDGVAAARLGKLLGKHVVISARGSDVNVISHHRRPRRQIRWAADSAAAVVTVSRALKDKLVKLGVDPEKITVLRNGVELDRFAPRDRAAIRARLGLSGRIWLTVGNLVELKGAHIAIEALAQVPDATLLIVGNGPDEQKLRTQVARLGLASRVHFLGAILQAELCDYYNAADVLMHCSSREGMPNVVLESLACGTPVVAAPFDGASEVIGSPEAGQIAESRTVDAITAAWATLQARAPNRDATRRYAVTQLGWPAIVEKQLALYANVVRACQGAMRSGVAA